MPSTTTATTSTTSSHNRAARAPRSAHPRNRSASDPFSDPVYAAPYLPYADDPRQQRSATAAAPLLPPKPPRKPKQYADHRDPRMLDAAVRDAVTIRSVDPSPRKMGRSMTSAQPSSTAPKPVSRRSYSQDSVTQAASAVEKAKGKKGKKGSSHADFIDSLDPSSFGVFHHDGPFDACAPSRNKHKNRAPMLAWSKEDNEPTSAAHHREQRRLATIDNFSASNADSPYAAAAAFAGTMDHHAPDKQVDRIAEAWGMHEPEPYEEFFGGGGGAKGDSSAASSIKNGIDNSNGRYRRTRDGRELRQDFKEHLDETRPQAARRTTGGRVGKIPPPQPIFVPGAGENGVSIPTAVPPPLGSADGPKRSKSIMQKFRILRDAPNVPMAGGGGAEYEEEGSPPSSVENYPQEVGTTAEGGRTGRPSHKHQNSFFGRFGRNASATPAPVSKDDYSPTQEQFVYVDKAKNAKQLPPRPPAMTPGDVGLSDRDDYFNSQMDGGQPTSPGGTGLGRKASLLKKVKGVVRNTR